VNEEYFIHLPMKMEPIVSSETSAIRTQTPGNYPKRNKLHNYVTLRAKFASSLKQLSLFQASFEKRCLAADKRLADGGFSMPDVAETIRKDNRDTGLTYTRCFCIDLELTAGAAGCN